MWSGKNKKRLAAYRRVFNSKHPNSIRVLEVRDTSCVDCGVRLPAEVMELDHVHGVKAHSLAQGRRERLSPEELEAEIAKCEVRCPSCHKMRHWRERKARYLREAA